MVARRFAVGRGLRRVPDFETVSAVGPALPAIPAVGAVHGRGGEGSVDLLRLIVDPLVLAAPEMDEAHVAGKQQAIVEGRDRTRHAVAFFALPGLRHEGREAPAVDAASPVAAD